MNDEHDYYKDQLLSQAYYMLKKVKHVFESDMPDWLTEDIQDLLEEIKRWKESDTN